MSWESEMDKAAERVRLRREIRKRCVGLYNDTILHMQADELREFLASHLGPINILELV